MGVARTGKLLAVQHENVQPDILILGKALSGGAYPVSAVLTNDSIMNVIKPGQHGSTFGGNPLAAAIGKRSLEVIQEDKLVENSNQQGKYFLDELKKIESPILSEIRGKGLWIGVEIDTKFINGRNMCKRLLKKGILSKETHASTIRFAPPLIIKKKEIDWAVLVIKETLKEIEKEHNKY